MTKIDPKQPTPKEPEVKSDSEARLKEAFRFLADYISDL